MTTSHTFYQTTGGSIDPTTGAGGVDTTAPGNITGVDPEFVDYGDDYHLTADSPLLDAGAHGTAPPTLDRDGKPRVLDGNGDGIAIRDLGAYEFGDVVPPETTITSGPSGVTNDGTPTFAFTSEPGATFECRIAGAYAACASPFTSAPLADGSHTFEVRATDASANVEPVPATMSFTIDAVAPQTTFTRTPAKKVFTKKVRFRFSSPEAGVTFQCKRDAKAWRPCTSPLRWKVKLGKHVLLVRAIDTAGNVDATPARYRFKRLPKP